MTSKKDDNLKQHTGDKKVVADKKKEDPPVSGIVPDKIANEPGNVGIPRGADRFK